jgi:hypothetical protein
MNHSDSTTASGSPCQYCRSKEMYHSPPGQEEDPFSSGIYWCAKTQDAFGPDGLPAGKSECCTGRSCYIS